MNLSQIQSRPHARSKATQNHWLSEQIFDWSGVPATHLRATFFMQWLLYISKLHHFEAATIDQQEGRLAGVTDVASTINGQPPATVEEFVGENRSMFELDHTGSAT